MFLLLFSRSLLFSASSYFRLYSSGSNWTFSVCLILTLISSNLGIFANQANDIIRLESYKKDALQYGGKGGPKRDSTHLGNPLAETHRIEGNASAKLPNPRIFEKSLIDRSNALFGNAALPADRRVTGIPGHTRQIQQQLTRLNNPKAVNSTPESNRNIERAVMDTIHQNVNNITGAPYRPNFDFPEQRLVYPASNMGQVFSRQNNRPIIEYRYINNEIDRNRFLACNNNREYIHGVDNFHLFDWYLILWEFCLFYSLQVT